MFTWDTQSHILHQPCLLQARIFTLELSSSLNTSFLTQQVQLTTSTVTLTYFVPFLKTILSFQKPQPFTSLILLKLQTLSNPPLVQLNSQHICSPILLLMINLTTSLFLGQTQQRLFPPLASNSLKLSSLKSKPCYQFAWPRSFWPKQVSQMDIKSVLINIL